MSLLLFLFRSLSLFAYFTLSSRNLWAQTMQTSFFYSALFSICSFWRLVPYLACGARWHLNWIVSRENKEAIPSVVSFNAYKYADSQLPTHSLSFLNISEDSLMKISSLYIIFFNYFRPWITRHSFRWHQQIQNKNQKNLNLNAFMFAHNGEWVSVGNGVVYCFLHSFIAAWMDSACLMDVHFIVHNYDPFSSFRHLRKNENNSMELSVVVWAAPCSVSIMSKENRSLHSNQQSIPRIVISDPSLFLFL